MAMEAACVTDNKSPHRAEGHWGTRLLLLLCRCCQDPLFPWAACTSPLEICSFPAHKHTEICFVWASFLSRSRTRGEQDPRPVQGVRGFRSMLCFGSAIFKGIPLLKWLSRCLWVLTTDHFCDVVCSTTPWQRHRWGGWKAATQGQPEARIF